MNKNRKLWVAIIFSILAPGLGQIYCGHLIRGLIFLGLLTSVSFGKNFILLLAMQQSSTPYFTLSIIILLLISVYILAMLDSILLAQRHGLEFTGKGYNKWYIYLPVFALAFLVIRPIGLHPFIVQAYIMPWKGMIPTIYNGNRILVDNLTYDSKKACRGDIIAFKHPDNQKSKHVKRVIGLPGETIEIRNKQVYIDGNILHESYVVHYDLLNEVSRVYEFRDSFPLTLIPRGQYFVMGDNRDYSADSRLWGFLDHALIEGEVKAIYSFGSELIWKKIDVTDSN
ncbi:MAG: signal peptidase I [bacterium]